MPAQDDTIDAIYEAAIVPELWPQVLDKMAVLSDTIGGLLIAVSPVASGILGVPPTLVPQWTSSTSVADYFSAFLNGGWMQRNTRAARALKLDHAGFVTDLDLYTEDEIEIEPMYQFAREMGLGWCAGTSIFSPSGDALIFDLERAHADGPVSREAIARLDPLRPHLARAALLSSRLGLEKAKAATAALGSLGLPAAILSSRNSIIAANSMLEALMPLVVVERSQGRFHLVDPAADTLFVSALAQAHFGLSKNSLAGSPALSIPIPAKEEQLAMVVHIVPMRRAALDIFTGATTLVIVTPVCPAEVPTANVIQGLFDLTAAEARVAREIAAGETIKEIAAQSKKSEETIRSQLKSVFAKTGVTRQADLVNLLGNINPFR